MKRLRSVLLVNEMCIKITMKYHFTHKLVKYKQLKYLLKAGIQKRWFFSNH